MELSCKSPGTDEMSAQVDNLDLDPIHNLELWNKSDHGVAAVELLFLLLKQLLLERLNLVEKSSIFICKMCVVLIHPIKIVAVPRKNCETPNWFLGFLEEKDTCLKTIVEIVGHFV